MNIQTPIEAIGLHVLNAEIKAQSDKWDAEAHFTAFEQALDLLDIMCDGLPDDPKVSNALSGLHKKFTEIYLQSKAHIEAE